MKYWVNKEASSNNVVVLAKTGVLIASCAEEACDDIDKKLAANTSPLSLFAKDDVNVVKFTQIRRILSRSTDDEVEITYSEKKETDTVYLSFASGQDKQNFFTVLAKLLPANLKKSEYQQSALAAILPSLVSAIAAGSVSYFYINRLRWVTLIVGGLWLALSVYMLATRLRKPPLITRWAVSGQYAKKAIGGIKAAFSYVVVAAIVIGFSSRLPLTHGEGAIYDQIYRYELVADEVEQLVENGADPNYHSQDESENPLHIAVYREEPELVTALLAHGADPLWRDSEGYTALEAAVMYADGGTINAVLEGINSVSAHTRLMEAAAYRSLELEQLNRLQSLGFDLHQQDQQGKNILQLAIEQDASYGFIAYLISMDVNRSFTIEGETPVNYLKDRDRLDVVRLFEGEGPSLSPERNKELQELLDQFVISESKAAIQNSGKAGRLVLALADVDDDEWDADEFREVVYKRALQIKRTQLILGVYEQACNLQEFTNFSDLKTAIQTRQQTRQPYFDAVDLLVERDQMIGIDGETHLPSALIAEYESEAAQMQANLSMPTAESEQAIIEQCQRQFEKLNAADLDQTGN